jgi:hypothetical protein
MTQSTQKKKGRKPKAKMAVVSEPIKETVKKVAKEVVAEATTPVTAPVVEAIAEVAPKVAEKPQISVEAQPKEKIYEAEKWATAYVKDEVVKESTVKVIEEPAIKPTNSEVKSVENESWFTIAHEYTKKKSIWQKIVSFFTGK